MPFLVCKVNVPVSQDQERELKARLGQAIAHIPGKNERGLLVCIEPDAHLWLAGNDDPIAYVEASVFANEDHAGYRAFSVDTAAAFAEVLGIPQERVYVRYAEIPVWSVGEMLIDRRMFG
ncbi:phenylpyruvate tautomerase MIF-related protein [Slackia heliotrinireducens]|uniref:phenylpyruvate tautomerase MIF-related protein n=1 Tax=Slackia heliotrinireducens TaxID=84110 RepID=UPI00331571D6